MAQNIGLFGGTFDPVHNGHISISKAFLSSGLIDELWILLTPDPPHKQNNVHADYADRRQMLNLAFTHEKRVRISTVENTLPSPSYSIQTIHHLKKRYPEYNFFLCIGGDSLSSFHKWYKYREILDECELIVAHRPGFNESNIPIEIKNKAHFINNRPLDISSTEIRNRCSKGEKIKHLLPQSVADYIQDKQLYHQSTN